MFAGVAVRALIGVATSLVWFVMGGINAPRALRGCRWIGCVVVLAASHPAARANDIPAVNLTASGPDRDLPVGKPFYVAGTARETTLSVQAIVVRKGSPVLGGTSGPRCSELRKQLGEFRAPETETEAKPAPAPAPPGPPPDKAAKLEDLDKGYFVLEPGSYAASKIWVNGSDKALVTATWQRGELSGAQSFKLLVSGDSDFFRAGYSYCLFVLARDNIKISVENKVKDALDRHHEAMSLCVRAPPDACDDACKEQHAAAQHKCEDAAIETLRKTTQDLGVKSAPGLLNAASWLRERPRALRYMLESWRSGSDPAASASSFLRRIDLPPFIPLPPLAANGAGQRIHVPLAEALAKLLSFHTGLFPRVDGKARRLTYYTLDGKTNVNLLGLRGDGAIVGSEDGTPTHTAALPRKLDELPLPSTTVTARDLVELLQGRLRLAKYQALKDVIADLRDDFEAPYGASKDKLTTLSGVTKQVGGLADAARRAFAASTGFDCGAGTYPAGAEPPAGPERDLGEWLRCAAIAETTCADLAKDWKAHRIEDAPACGDNPLGWPGYEDIGQTPLDAIAVAGQDLLDAHAIWGAAKESLVIDKIKTTAVRSEGKIGFTQETWVGSYLTPVLGYAYLPYSASALFYAAVQLHFIPNPVDEPQWSHGNADLGRAVALEFGFAPNAGSFGPDGRYDGPWGLPPLFGGLAFHPIAYTSISGGLMLADTRTTTLPQERRSIACFGYIGVSLQGNLPDLLYNKLGYGLKTSAEK